MLLDWLFPKICVVCGERGAYFCKDCVLKFPIAHLICPMCGKGSIGGVVHVHCNRLQGMDGLVNIFPYRDGIQDAVKRLKYRFVREMGSSFIEAVSLRVDPAVLDFFQRERFVIVPVPLHRARERWRGFNQAALLGELLAEKWGLEYKPLLVRIENTDALAELRVRVSQSEKRRLKEKYTSLTQQKLARRELIAKKKSKKRTQQMKGAFRIRGQNSPKSFPKNFVSGQVATGQADVRGQKFILVDDVWTSGATMLECCKVLKRSGTDKVWGFTFARSGW